MVEVGEFCHTDVTPHSTTTYHMVSRTILEILKRQNVSNMLLELLSTGNHAERRAGQPKRDEKRLN